MMILWPCSVVVLAIAVACAVAAVVAPVVVFGFEFSLPVLVPHELPSKLWQFGSLIRKFQGMLEITPSTSQRFPGLCHSSIAFLGLFGFSVIVP